jgi:hypothetical protein
MCAGHGWPGLAGLPLEAAHGRDRGPGVTGPCDQRPGQPLEWDAHALHILMYVKGLYGIAAALA